MSFKHFSTFVFVIFLTASFLLLKDSKTDFKLSRRFNSPKEIKFAIERFKKNFEMAELTGDIQNFSGEAEKEDHPDLFAQYEHDIRTRNGEENPTYPPNYRIKELLKARGLKSTKDLKRISVKGSDLHWVERGPGNISGRTRGIVIDPDDPTARTWFVGSVGGGVWKTTNAGESWINLTPQLPNLATSTIAMAPSNHNVLYVGTGEGFYNVDEIDGTGIWKTTDKGETWQQLESTTDPKKFKNIMRIVVNAEDENIVLAASGLGFNGGALSSKIYRSTDGGETWNAVLATGSNNIEQIVADPVNPDIYYATVNTVGVYKSLNGGKTWQKYSNGISKVGRLELAVSPVDHNRVYISAQGGKKGSTFYYSTDGGKNWTGIEPRYDWLGGQGWYDNTIAAHPYDVDVCFVGGVSLWRVELTGVESIQMISIADGYGQYGGKNRNVHVDHHNIVIVKTDTLNKEFMLVNGNDGGVSYSTDGGDSFTQPCNGYNTTQFYGVDKKNGADEYVGGMQDNSTWRSPSGVSADSLSQWIFQWGGDGYEADWNYKDPNKILVSSQYNNVARSLDGGKTYHSVVGTVDDVGSDKAPFFTKIAKSKQDADLVFLMGSSGVWRSSDFGSTWRLVKLSGGSFGGTSTFSQIKISLADPQYVWVGSNLNPTGGIFVSTNGGFNFTKTNGYTEVSMGRLTGLATHPFNPKTAYVTFSFADAPKILKTTDLGQTWHDISGFGTSDESSTGFPDVAVYSLLVMPYDTTIIWAGTEIGIFETTDNAQSWHFLESNLPAVAVYDMEIVNDQVIIATHGRGVWTVSLPQLNGYEPPAVKLAPVLKKVNYSPGVLSYEIQLRDVYDSTQVLVNNHPIKTLITSDVKDTLLIIPFAPDKTGKYFFSVVSYDGGRRIFTETFTKRLFTISNPQQFYVNDFSTNDSAFVGDDFVIKRYFGFKNPAIHSKHPYENKKDVTYTLKIPIVVQPTDAFLNYDDIALVEPGMAGAQFGDPLFYDYVIVEGSKDGVNWTPLAPGYDASYDSTWLNVYKNGGRISTLFLNHQINLLDTYNAGDTILIRFRLFADDETNGWGWAIDNLEIQKHLTNVEKTKMLPVKFALEQNYPNPFGNTAPGGNATTTIKYSVPAVGTAHELSLHLTVYDVLGRVVATLVNQKQSPGNYSVVFNAGNLASGIYFYRLQVGNFIATKKMILLR